jgi:hypothetical protein
LINKFIAYFISATLVFHNTVDCSEMWTKILHLTPANAHDIRNTDFYFEDVRDPIYQLYRFKDFNSYDVTKDHLPCIYPARYFYLNRDSDLANILERCDDLNRFYHSFKNKKLSLAHAEEYLGAPSSVFGHLYLVMHNEDIPGPGAKTVSFNAVIEEGVSFIEYILNGINGSFAGEFVGDLNVIKEHEYLYKEQRKISYFEIDLNDDQYNMLIFLLFELRGVQFDYYFFTKNCAYQIDYILSTILNMPTPNNYVYSLPKDVISKFKKKLKREIIVYPLEVVLDNVLSSETELSIEFDRDVAKYKFLTGKSLTEAEIASLKTSNSSFREINFREIEGNSHIIGAKRLKIEASDKKVLRGSFTPLLKYDDSVEDPMQGFSSFTMGRTVLEIDSKKKVRVSEMTLLEVNSFPHFNLLSKKISWSLNIGLDRLQEISKLRYTTALGIGLSRKLAGLTIGFNIGPDFSFNFPGSRTDLIGRLVLKKSFFNNTSLFISTKMHLKNEKSYAWEIIGTHFIGRTLSIDLKYEKPSALRDSKLMLVGLSSYF